MPVKILGLAALLLGHNDIIGAILVRYWPLKDDIGDLRRQYLHRTNRHHLLVAPTRCHGSNRNLKRKSVAGIGRITKMPIRRVNGNAVRMSRVHYEGKLGLAVSIRSESYIKLICVGCVKPDRKWWYLPDYKRSL